VSRSRTYSLNIVVAIIGVALLVFTVGRAGGWASIVDGIASIGWWFIVVLLLGAFRMMCRTRAWMACVTQAPSTNGEQGSGELRFADAFAAWLVSDAMGNLTPLGLLASEPTKILMVRSKISTVASVASVTIENAFYTASVCAVLLTGTWLFLQRANVPPGLEQISELIVAGVAVAAIVGVWFARAAGRAVEVRADDHEARRQVGCAR
jgi:hypothetical protein